MAMMELPCLCLYDSDTKHRQFESMITKSVSDHDSGSNHLKLISQIHHSQRNYKLQFQK